MPKLYVNLQVKKNRWFGVAYFGLRCCMLIKALDDKRAARILFERFMRVEVSPCP